MGHQALDLTVGEMRDVHHRGQRGVEQLVHGSLAFALPLRQGLHELGNPAHPLLELAAHVRPDLLHPLELEHHHTALLEMPHEIQNSYLARLHARAEVGGLPLNRLEQGLPDAPPFRAALSASMLSTPSMPASPGRTVYSSPRTSAA